MFLSSKMLNMLNLFACAPATQATLMTLGASFPETMTGCAGKVPERSASRGGLHKASKAGFTRNPWQCYFLLFGATQRNCCFQNSSFSPNTLPQRFQKSVSCFLLRMVTAENERQGSVEGTASIPDMSGLRLCTSISFANQTRDGHASCLGVQATTLTRCNNTTHWRELSQQASRPSSASKF